MSMGQSEFNEALATLKNEYVAKLPGELNQVRELFWHFIQDQSQINELRDCYVLAHNLKGSGTTFGYPEITAIAADMVSLLGPVQDGAEVLTPRTTTEISHLIYLLEEQVDRVSLTFPRAFRNGETPDSQVSDNEIPANPRLIYVLEDDQALSSLVKFHLEVLGYEVKAFSEVPIFREAIDQIKPALALIDVVFPEDNMAGLNVFDELSDEEREEIPLMVISNRDDIDSRLKSVRLGVKVYLKKPVDLFVLIDEIDVFLSKTTDVCYKVMVVDDEPLMADYHCSLLDRAGFNTLAVTEPMDVLEKLNDYVPDLIVLDLRMPGCSGIELAKVIRQKKELSATPIVYLTGEKALGTQKMALYSGGDDYLLKPVDPDLFVSQVRSRAMRFHHLRSIMAHDPLTGLLNYSSLLDGMDGVISRARRSGVELVCGMIDVDDFKAVNDRHGHQVGDLVLKTLSKLLKKRLRRSDVVGRYGGEEFTVLLETNSTNGFKVLDEIREDFSKIVFDSRDGEFHATFSVGLAMFPSFRDRVTLIEAADRALYRAKHEGKNRIVVF